MLYAIIIGANPLGSCLLEICFHKNIKVTMVCDQIKQDEMGGSCSGDSRDEKGI